MEEDRMKVIARFPDVSSAEMAKSMLEAQEIAAWIPDANLAGLDWRLGTAIGGVRLQVADEDVEAATELLALVAAAVDETAPSDYTDDEMCPHCRSTHIGPDDQRRLRMLTLLAAPVAVVTLPMMLIRRGRVRCGDCGQTWRSAAPEAQVRD
jgi:hypothetical protein